MEKEFEGRVLKYQLKGVLDADYSSAGYRKGPLE